MPKSVFTELEYTGDGQLVSNPSPDVEAGSSSLP